MESRIFSYHWSIKVLKWFFISGWIAFLASVIMLIISMFRIAYAIAGKPDNAFGPTIIVLFVALAFSFMCISGFDRFPEIVIDSKGATVRYLLRKICVPWEDIIKLENRETPWLSKMKNKFVITKKFPLYYRVSNIFLHGTLKQGFIINSSLLDYETLSISIQNHISTN